MKMNTRMFVAALMASGILTSCSFGGPVMKPISEQKLQPQDKNFRT